MTTLIPKPLFDFGVRRQIDIQRYGSHVVEEVAALLGESEKEVMAKILAAGDPDTWTAHRLQALFAEIGDMTFEAHTQAVKKLARDMRDFASHEAEVAAGLIASQVPATFSMLKPSAAQLAAIVDKTPITVGPDRKLLLEEIFQGLAQDKEEAIRGAVRLGMVEGESTPEIVRRLVGTRSARYKDGVLERNRRGATAMVRTIVNHVSNGAAQRTYAENDIKKWVFLATLDFRTTLQCRGFSGQIFPVGEGPIPPLHVACRSFAIPRTATFRELGVNLDEMPVSTRAAKGGPVKADISMDEWMRTQSPKDIKDMLGATRAQLFLDGKMSVKDFTDDKGLTYTLTQLEHRHQVLFDNVFGPSLK